MNEMKKKKERNEGIYPNSPQTHISNFNPKNHPLCVKLILSHSILHTSKMRLETEARAKRKMLKDIGKDRDGKIMDVKEEKQGITSTTKK